jgi:hypothetical protein
MTRPYRQAHQPSPWSRLVYGAACFTVLVANLAVIAYAVLIFGAPQ